MSEQRSYTKIERDVMNDYRRKLDLAESTEDVKKEFVHVVRELLDRVFGGELTCDYEDIVLDPEAECGYRLGGRLQNAERLDLECRQSDLASILERLARKAANRYAHLEKHPDKTESKMFPKPRQDG